MKIIDFKEKDLEGFYKIISKNIVRLRKERNISQLKLANAIGHKNATFIGKAELLAEGKHFNLEHIYKISAIFEVNIMEFFKN